MARNIFCTVSGLTVLAFMFFNNCPQISCQQNRLPPIEEVSASLPPWFDDTAPESVLWGIGAGQPGSISVSCEEAKFSAQAAIANQIYCRTMFANTPYDTAVAADSVIDRLNLYQNAFYELVAIMASQSTLFELSEFVTVERRTKTADGTIWYLLSFKKSDLDKVEPAIKRRVEETFQSLIDSWENGLNE